MRRIFISYRREDSSGEAGRIADHLASHYGTGQFFMDIDTIDPGVDFEAKLHDALLQCDILLVIIGRNWLGLTDKSGRRRVDDPNDFVRQEVSLGLTRDIRVIPVLVQNAEIPQRSELPDDLSPLSKRQAVRIRHESFHHDIDRLIRMLDRVLSETKLEDASWESEAAMPSASGGAVVRKTGRLADRGRRGLSVKIEDTCTACGLCSDTCPDVFELGDEIAEVKVDEVPAELEEAVQQAADECPVEAIIIE